MSVIDRTILTAVNLVAAFQGAEDTGVKELKSALGQLEDVRRERFIAQGIGMGRAREELDAFLASDSKASPPAKRARTPKGTLAPNTDDATLLALLFTELDKGSPLTAKALARRTGASMDRVTALLRNNESDRLRINGLKWSRVRA